MVFFITGATGNTGSAIVKLFDADTKYKDTDVLLAYRSTKPISRFDKVKFDWQDNTTWNDVFANRTIDTIYILFPITFYDTLTISKGFLDLAKSKGTKRLVLLGGTPFTKGQAPVGDVWGYIIDKLKVDYTILRPTGFFTLLKEPPFLASISNSNNFTSATVDGRIPLVSIDDIADQAFKALTASPSLNKEQAILGPELFSYSRLAELLSAAIGREIAHVGINSPQSLIMYKAVYKGVTDGVKLAEYWSKADERQAEGMEEGFFYDKASYRGSRKLVDFLKVEAQKGTWNPR